MPKSYLEHVIDREGEQGTLKKVVVGSRTYSSTQNYLITSALTLTETSFSYIPMPAKQITKIVGGGWEDKVDTVITVSPDLDISTRNKTDTDQVLLTTGREYKVIWVQDDRFGRHRNRLVGIKELTANHDP